MNPLMEAQQRTVILVEHAKGGDREAPIVGKAPLNTSRPFRAVARRAELAPDLRFHDLRHTFATWLAPHCSFPCLQALLAHSAGKSVTLSYTHPTFEEQLLAVEQLPRILSPAESAEAKSY